MRTATTFRTGHGGGRRLGSRNRVKREVRALMLKLERTDALHPDRWFLRLEEIALGEDLRAAVAAVKVLAEFRFGKPMQEAELSVSHDLGPSVVELLESIGRSPEHRARLEEREARLLAATVESEEEKPS